MEYNFKVSNVSRKIIFLKDGEYKFLVDVVQTGKEKYIARGIELDKDIKTEWIDCEGINPEFTFGKYLESII